VRRGREQSLTLVEAQVLALKVLKQVMEEKLDFNNVQLAVVEPNVRRGYKILAEAELKGLIAQMEPAAATPAAAEGTDASS
jgi:20S proteasome subunit alpha 5